jgi:plastocyanin domain-containing protein
MKGNIMRNLVLIALFAACAQQEQPVAQQQRTPAPATTTQVSSAPTSQVVSSDIPEHTIDVAGQFTPASVTLKAGQPARLRFRRSDKPTCADEIVIPDLKVRKRIAANQTVTIDIPAQQARTLTFACGMDMMKGSLVVQ